MPNRKPINTGRNLPLATLVGLVLFGLVLISTFVFPLLYLILLILLVPMAVQELAKAFAHQGIRLEIFILVFAGISMLIGAYDGGIEYLFYIYLISVLVLITASMRRDIDNFIKNATGNIFTLTYLPLMASFVTVMLQGDDDGPIRVFAFIMLTIAADTGAYFAGILFGKHLMSPKISPKKTWEGVAGAVVLQLVIGVLIFEYLLDEPYWKGLIAGLVLTATAIFGDLLESAIKRGSGIKDMSHTLPGHGGVLDRLDSLIPNAMVSWMIFSWLLP